MEDQPLLIKVKGSAEESVPLDYSALPGNLNYCTLLKELVQEKKIPMSRIDDAVRRVLRLKFRLGLFDHPNTLLKDSLYSVLIKKLMRTIQRKVPKLRQNSDTLRASGWSGSCSP